MRSLPAPEVTDAMLFALIIEHRDLLRLVGPYMCPGFSIKFQMQPLQSRALPFSCTIEKYDVVEGAVVQQWAHFGDGATIEQAAEEAVRSARLVR